MTSPTVRKVCELLSLPEGNFNLPAEFEVDGKYLVQISELDRRTFLAVQLSEGTVNPEDPSSLTPLIERAFEIGSVGRVSYDDPSKKLLYWMEVFDSDPNHELPTRLQQFFAEASSHLVHTRSLDG